MSEKSDKQDGVKQRTSDRLQHELLVAYRTVDGFITDWAVNISRGGLFINTDKPLPVGSTVRLVVALPGTQFPFDLAGKVIRVSEPGNDAGQTPGMGVEFVDVDEEKRSRIERFVDRLRIELPDAPPAKK